MTGGIPAALYLRLSSADGPAAESDSIQNQRAFLREWASRGGFVITREFVDDGHTGTDFDRPGFRRLSACLLDGSVRCVIVKDLSRLGRNYAETGRYLEEIFPRLGVRFIAVNDQYDSASSTACAQQMAVFKNVFNDFYAADASAKVRTSLKILKRQGKFLARQAPYGYRIDPRDRYHLLPDDSTAPVVRQIFAWFLQGESRAAIARRLNRQGILSPAAQKGLTDKSRNFTGLWNGETVRRILSHPVYQGDMAQQFTRTVSYKVHDRRRVAPEDWILVENTHEPLVSREAFACARQRLAVRPYEAAEKTEHPLTGLVYCARCGSPMYAKKRGRYWYLLCYGYYRAPAQHRCTAHSIREDLVLEAVQQAWQAVVQKYADREALADFCTKQRADGTHRQNRTRLLEQRLTLARSARLEAYRDKVRGILREEEFVQLSEQLRGEEEAYRRELAEAAQSGAETQRDEKIRRILCLEQMSKVQLHQLVRRITVEETKHLTITFVFSDPFHNRKK